MSAGTWLEEGATSARSFGAYDGEVTFARVGGSFYVELYDCVDKVRQVEVVDSKEILLMAHWIIKEFG